MKKSIKRTILLTTVLIFTFTSGAFASNLYNEWLGRQDYNQAMENMDAIGTRGQQLKGELDLAKRSNEQLENVVRDKENQLLDKDNQINAKDQQIEAKQKEIDNLRNQQGSNLNELRQAEIDMKSVKDKSQQVLDVMN